DSLLFLLLSFFSWLLRPPRSPLFPYTTLFRSGMPESTSSRVSVSPASGSGPPRGGAGASASRRNFGGFPGAGASSSSLRKRRPRSEEHTSELQSRENLVCRLLLEKKKAKNRST